jgi:hypothetical protein
MLAFLNTRQRKYQQQYDEKHQEEEVRPQL